MTTQVQDEYIFTSRIKSLGEQQNNEGWRLELEWKLPGSKFPLSLYGMKWEDVEGWKSGSTAEIHISKGNLKNDKDGRYTSDYFWDLTYIAEPSGEHLVTWSTPTGDAELPSRTASPEPQRGALTRPDDVQTRIDIGMAFNAAYTLVSAVRGSTGMDYEAAVPRIRWLRDLIYHEVIQKGIAPEGYCYLHEEHCRQGKTGKWGHQRDDGLWCVDHENGRGVLVGEEESPLAQTAMGMGANIADDLPDGAQDALDQEDLFSQSQQTVQDLPF